ncbi:MAG: esterase/lipase family protein [Aureispira sp.]
MPNNTHKDSEIQGLIRLVADATVGVTDLVEHLHQRVVHPPFLRSTPIQHLITKIAGVTYSSIRWSTRVVGGGLDRVAGQLTPWLGINETAEKEILRAALNGIVGDYLEGKDNPLKIDMAFQYQSKALFLDKEHLKNTPPKVNGKILLLVHGLCMSAGQWTREGHNHGTALAQELDSTVIYLQYNTGRHISANGQDFNKALEALIAHWPVPVEELMIVAHSMGGLVTRSALYYGQQAQKSWTEVLQKIVFLGTPHHGAPLERVGNYLDGVLEFIPYTQPFARLGKTRSAGITDLRYGNLIEEDWEGQDRFEDQGDTRKNIPLPQGISCYSIAAVLGKATTTATPQLVGDGLVQVKSALGQGKQAAQNLHFKKENTWVTYETTHFDLLSDAAVYAQIKTWLL